jgi:beta-lactamase class A
MEASLLAIAAGRCVSEGASREMRRVLEAQQIRDRLPRRLGEGVRVANKTGNFGDVSRDVGIVAWPEERLVVAVLTQSVLPGWRAASTIAWISEALVQVCTRVG